MNNIIGISLHRRDFEKLSIDTKIKDIPQHIGFESFNPSHAHIMGVQWQDFSYRVEIGLFHNEFPPVPERQMVPIYSIEEARKRFPFLFVETEPLLYRQFR